MTSDPSVYQQIITWVREAEPKSTEAAAQSGKYDQDYLVLSGQAREFRKRVMGTLSPAAMIKPKERVTLEEAKKLAAKEVEREVERRRRLNQTRQFGVTGAKNSLPAHKPHSFLSICSTNR